MQKKRLDQKVTVRLDPEQLAALDRVAHEEAVSVSFLVRHLVRRFLEQRRYTPGKSQLSITGRH